MTKYLLIFFLYLITTNVLAQHVSRQKIKEVTNSALVQATEEYKNKDQNLNDWQNKVIRYGIISMKFDYNVFGNAPFGEKSLYISLHGGGNTAAKDNDQQWENQKRLYKPAEGIYLVPRAPTNTWNLWHEAHIDKLFMGIIKSAIVFGGVNPNKVYLLGYSAGGDGVFQLAPRMADYWAAASMMAGHPGDASVLSLRNLPFAIFMGGDDGAYNRNNLARSWSKTLDSLHRADPQGYIHDAHVYVGLGHWMNRRDTIAIPWMAQFTRNPLPSKVVWVQDDRITENFYWLGTDRSQTKAGNKAVVSIDKTRNEITIDENTFPYLSVYLNDQLIDLDKPVIVRQGKKILFKGKLIRKESLVNESIERRLDINLAFCGKLVVTGGSVRE